MVRAAQVVGVTVNVPMVDPAGIVTGLVVIVSPPALDVTVKTASIPIAPVSVMEKLLEGSEHSPDAGPDRFAVTLIGISKYQNIVLRYPVDRSP
jgi:hypothetical protein